MTSVRRSFAIQALAGTVSYINVMSEFFLIA